MAQIECGRGHLYDPEKYPTCPYCKNNQQITVAAAGRTAPIRVTDAGRTAPLSATPVTAEQKTAPLTRPAAPGGARAPVRRDAAGSRRTRARTRPLACGQGHCHRGRRNRSRRCDLGRGQRPLWQGRA